MSYVRWLHRGRLARDEVGGKGASLAELHAAGFSVPIGFVLTAAAYRHFEADAGLAERLPAVLDRFDPKDAAALRQTAAEIRSVLEGADLPSEVAKELLANYQDLTSMAGEACAVRSSAVSEDGAETSFAGLYESYLNVRGPGAVLEAVRRCYDSLWSERALRYRALRTGNPRDAMAVVVMALVPSEVSGVAFTAHPVSGERDRILINSSWGLGEAIVSGRVTPDSFVVHKDTLAVLDRAVFPKEVALYAHPDGQGTIEVTPKPERAIAPSLSDALACEVGRVAVLVERHFGRPQDIEFAIAGGQLQLLQSRPITTLGPRA